MFSAIIIFHSAYMFVNEPLEPWHNQCPTVRQQSSSCLLFATSWAPKHQKAHHFTFRLPSPVQQENNPVCHVMHCQSVSPLDCDILYVSVLLFCMTTLGHVDAGPAYPPTAGVSSSSAGRGPPSGPPPSGRPPPEPLPGIPPVQPQRRHIQHLFCCF